MSKPDSLPSEHAPRPQLARTSCSRRRGVAAAGALAAVPANAGQLVSDDLLEIRRLAEICWTASILTADLHDDKEYEAALAEQNRAYAQFDDLATRIRASRFAP